MIRQLACLTLGAAVLGAPSFAQDKDEMVVVTANRVSRDDSGLPYVSLRIPAEFVIFTLQLETGTRAVDERVRELERSFAAITQRAARAQGIGIEVGEPGESAAVETAAVSEIVQTDYDDKNRSFIPLVLKVDVRGGDTFPAIRARTEKFVADNPVFGRVEAVMGDDQYIGVNDPKKHREELLRKIASDTRLLQSIFAEAPASTPAISLTGLGGRAQTRPVGPLELEMYIPYEVVLASPQSPR